MAIVVIAFKAEKSQVTLLVTSNLDMDMVKMRLAGEDN